MNPTSAQFSTVPSSIPSSYTLHSAIKDKLPLEEIRELFNIESINQKLDGMLPLDLAFLNHDDELMVELINAGAKFKDNEAVFHNFCKKGNVKVVRALIENGRINPNNFPIALNNALTNLKHEIISLLLSHGANLFILNKGAMLAHAACIVKEYEILKMFIEIGGVDINDQSNPQYPGYTFLMMAASQGNLDVVNWLLGKGADSQIYCHEGFTAFYKACQLGFLNIAQHLHNVSKAKLGSAQNVLNTRYGKSLQTVLHSASFFGRTEVVKWLLEEQADPLIPDDKGFTSWHMADFLDIMKAMYDTGKIDLNTKYEHLANSTILEFCSAHPNPLSIRWLLDNGADPMMSGGDMTPIEIAFAEKLEGNVRAFIDKDFCNINKVYGRCKCTALSLAAINRMYPIAKWLLDNGADPSIESAQGWTSFFFACSSGELRIAQLLYEHSKSPKSNFNLDLNKKYRQEGFTALMAASYNPDVIKWLLDNGADPFLTDVKGYTPFYYCCESGELDVAKILYKLSIDPNQRYGEEDTTALHAATNKEQAVVVEWLLANGADPFIINKVGETPFDLAIKQKNVEIIKAFINSLMLKIDSDVVVIKFIDVVFPLIELLLKNGTALSTFELSIKDHFPVSLKNRIKLLKFCSYFINWIIKQGSESISEKIEEFITLNVEDKLTPLKEVQLTSDLAQEILHHFIPLLYKHFPQLKYKKPGLISVNKEIFTVIREVVFKYKWMCDIQYNDNIKLKVKSETSLDKLFEFIITLCNTLQEQRAIIENGNKNDTIVIATKPETKVVPKQAEPAPQVKPAKPQHSSSSSSVNLPIPQKKPVKIKKGKRKQVQKAKTPKPQVITTANHQKEHPSQVIIAADIPLPPVFPPQMIPLKTPLHDLEDFMVESSQPLKEDHQLSELKKILSSPDGAPLHLSLFDEVCKINRDHHQVPGFFAFDSLLIHSSHKIFHSDFMCDLFFQFVKEGYQDPFKPEQLLESFSTKHFMNELTKHDGDRKQTIRNMIKILPSLESKHAISGAIMIIGEQAARLKGDPILKDILDICMKYKAYRNLRHGPDSNLEEVQFDNEGVIEEGLINSGADWEEYLKKIINDFPADLIRLTQSRIMS